MLSTLLLVLFCNINVKLCCKELSKLQLNYYLVKFSVPKTQDMKNSITFISAFMLLIAFPLLLAASSMGEIMGKVSVKETAAPVANAIITFENSMGKTVVTANEHGMYYGTRVPSGRYEMRVEYNNRTFVMKSVRIYDGYATEANFTVSNDDSLAAIVEIPRTDALYSGSAPTGITLSNNNTQQPTRPLNEALSMQPGMDVRDGKLYVKGSGEVKFFIDGCPTIAPPAVQRIW